MSIKSIINETITSDTATGPIKVRRGGVYSLEYIWTAGTIDLELQISFDGATYVKALDVSDASYDVTMATGTRYYKREFLSQVDVYYRIVSTNNTSGNVQARLTRIVSER